jgi:hypothetical protein
MPAVYPMAGQSKKKKKKKKRERKRERGNKRHKTETETDREGKGNAGDRAKWKTRLPRGQRAQREGTDGASKGKGQRAKSKGQRPPFPFSLSLLKGYTYLSPLKHMAFIFQTANTLFLFPFVIHPLSSILHSPKFDISQPLFTLSDKNTNRPSKDIRRRGGPRCLI